MVLNHIYSYQAAGERKPYFNPAEVDTRRGPDGTEVHEVLTADLGTVPVTHEGLGKMSKSEGNGVDPEGLIERFGADTARLFMMFASPPEQTLEWSDSGVEGSYRFLKRLWNFAAENENSIKRWAKDGERIGRLIDWENIAPEQAAVRREVQEAPREIHINLTKADYDLSRNQFNTVASATMKILNALERS